MELIKLPTEFTGKGEVRGFHFTKTFENNKGYVYRVGTETHNHFEVFYKKQSPICIDFKKRIYSETDFKETYPKANSFGVWAWTVNSLDKGIEKLNN